MASEALSLLDGDRGSESTGVEGRDDRDTG